jgi:hypothetical protein
MGFELVRRTRDPVSSTDDATEGLSAVGVAGPVALPAADHADLPYPSTHRAVPSAAKPCLR